MKKIFKFLTGTIKGILSNLDYLAAFIGGALAYKLAPMQLEGLYDAIITFDYMAAWMFIKSVGSSVVDYAVMAYDWVASFFMDAPAEVQ